MKIDGIKYVENKCEDCGAVFYSKAKPRVMKCSECKKKHNEKLRRERFIMLHKKKDPYYIPKEEKELTNEKETVVVKSINECVSIIENYNNKHHTHYTYGSFPFPELLR